MGKKTQKESKRRFQPTLDLLEFFHAFAEAFVTDHCRSYEQIGAKLGISRSYVSQQLKSLEDQLARRHGKKISLATRTEREGIDDLTEAGKRLRGQVLKLMDQYSRSLSTVADGSGAPSSRISVAATHLIHDHVLAGAIADYQRHMAQQGRLEFNVIQTPYIDGVVESLERGEAEFGVGPTLNVLGSRTIRVDGPILETPMCLVCHPLHPLGRVGTSGAAKRESVDTSELLLLNARIAPSIAASLREMGVRRLAHETLPSIEGIISRVQMGLGVGVVPRWAWILRDHIQQGKIVVVPTADFGRYCVSVYRRRGARMSSVAKGFLDSLRTHASMLERASVQYVSRKVDQFPDSVAEYRHGCYLSSEGWNRPFWRRCTYTWLRCSKGEEVIGRGVNTHDGKPYDIKGRFEENLVSWLGIDASDSGDRDIFVATFVSHTASPQALIGNWTGFNDEGDPVTGAFILSSDEIDFYTASELARESKLRLFLNADPHRFDPEHKQGCESVVQVVV